VGRHGFADVERNTVDIRASLVARRGRRRPRRGQPRSLESLADRGDVVVGTAAFVGPSRSLPNSIGSSAS
jgi:hypothetical protein